jgi:hypothetical protein
VVVEVYLLRCHPGGLLAFRCVTGQLGAAETPDEAAARIGRIPAGGPGPGVAVHSTSWRHLGDGSIVLAYAVAPDPAPDAIAVPIPSLEIPHGPAPAGHRRRACNGSRSRRTRPATSPWSPTPIPTSARYSPHPELARSLGALPRVPAGQLPASRY